MNPTYQTARSAHGPTVYRWIAARIPLRCELLKDDPAFYSMRSWRQGDRLVGIAVLDHLLTPLGIHLSELDEECWRWAAPGVSGKYRRICEAVVSEWLDGASIRSLSRDHGICRETVERWTEGLQDLARTDGRAKGQQADGHGAPVPHPDRARGNGQPGIAAGVHNSPCAGAPAADLEEVAA